MRSRRYHSVTFKRQVVLEVLGGEASRAALARRYGLSPSLIRNWEKAYHADRLDDTARQASMDLEAGIRELERMVGQLATNSRSLFPKTIQLETTTICPAHCIMCPHKQMSPRPNLMDMRIIEKVIDECAGKDVTIIPHQMGDPLADNRMMDILKKCKDAGLKILMSTSGILLDSVKAKQMVDMGVDVINISFDSLDKRTYEKIRGLSFDEVMKNVMGLMAIKRPPTSVWVSAVDIFFTERTREHFLDYWSKVADHVQITPFARYPKVNDRRLPKGKRNDSRECQRLENDLIILSNGEVAKCCIDFEGMDSFGNVGYEPISEIWNGEKRKAFLDRINLAGRRKLRPCNICVL